MSKINAELALALALDGKLSRLDEETATLVSVVDALRALPEPEIDAKFAMALEQRILTEGLEDQTVTVGRPQLAIVPDVEPAIAEDPTPADNVFTMPRRKVRVRKSFAAIAACFMLGAFPVMATAKSLPGDLFYSAKQSLRSAKIALFGGPMQDAMWRLGFAADHVREAEALTALGADPKLVASALDMAAYEFAKANDTVADVDDPNALETFAAEAEATEKMLEKSGPNLPQEAAAAFDRAMEAAQALTAALANALGIEQNPIAPVIATLANEVADAIDGTATAPTMSNQSSSKAPVSAGEESAPAKTEPKPQDGEPSDPGVGAGKALREASDEGCEIPGSYEVDLITENGTSKVCTAVITAI